jgi:arylsulfatase A-like enzyme
MKKKYIILIAGIFLAGSFFWIATKPEYIFNKQNIFKKKYTNKKKSGKDLEKNNTKLNSCKDCNVILVTLDTVRADHLSPYGYIRDTSSNINKLAEKGIVFENNFVQMPYTPTSHWSIFSGTYPHTHKHYSPGIVNGHGTLDDNTSVQTITNRLKEGGYVNLAVLGSKMVVNLAPEFDKAVLVKTGGMAHTSQKTTTKAMELITKNKDKKFFLWLHYWDPHRPYAPPQKYVYHDGRDVFLGKDVYVKKYNQKFRENNSEKEKGEDIYQETLKMQDAYDGEIEHVDEEFGRVVKLLKELGLQKKTIIIVTSDHGELFGEHRENWFRPKAFDEPAFEHYGTLYDEEIRTPLIIYNPQKEVNNKHITALTQEIDIAPTILDMLGLKIPTMIEGKSLLPLIKGEAEKVNDYIFSILKFVRDEASMGGRWKDTNIRKLRATLRTKEWKLIRFENLKNDKKETKYVLYNLQKGEDQDVLKENRKIADDMIAQLENMIAEDKAISEDISLSEEELNILRSLGYLK